MASFRVLPMPDLVSMFGSLRADPFLTLRFAPFSSAAVVLVPCAADLALVDPLDWRRQLEQDQAHPHREVL